MGHAQGILHRHCCHRTSGTEVVQQLSTTAQGRDSSFNQSEGSPIVQTSHAFADLGILRLLLLSRASGIGTHPSRTKDITALG